MEPNQRHSAFSVPAIHFRKLLASQGIRLKCCSILPPLVPGRSFSHGHAERALADGDWSTMGLFKSGRQTAPGVSCLKTALANVATQTHRVASKQGRNTTSSPLHRTFCNVNALTHASQPPKLAPTTKTPHHQRLSKPPRIAFACKWENQEIRKIGLTRTVASCDDRAHLSHYSPCRTGEGKALAIDTKRILYCTSQLSVSSQPTFHRKYVQSVPGIFSHLRQLGCRPPAG